MPREVREKIERNAHLYNKAVLPVNAERTLADVRAETIRELIRIAERTLDGKRGCRCSRCCHTRGIITLAREMVP